MIIAWSHLLRCLRWAAWRSPSPAAMKIRKSASPAVAKPKDSRAARSTVQSEAAQKRKNVAALLEGRGKEPGRAAQAGKAYHAPPAGAGGLSPMPVPGLSGSCLPALGALVALACLVTHQTPLVIGMAVFAVGLGLPRWVLGFLTRRRRKKKFTEEFANAIDVIVRSVQVGPSHQRSAAHRRARDPRSRGQPNSPGWSKA